MGVGAARGADVIVVAAGSSQRMGGIDKLAWPVGGRPVLAWTLEALAASPEWAEAVKLAAAYTLGPPQTSRLAPTTRSLLR